MTRKKLTLRCAAAAAEFRKNAKDLAAERRRCKERGLPRPTPRVWTPDPKLPASMNPYIFCTIADLAADLTDIERTQATARAEGGDANGVITTPYHKEAIQIRSALYDKQMARDWFSFPATTNTRPLFEQPAPRRRRPTPAGQTSF